MFSSWLRSRIRKIRPVILPRKFCTGLRLEPLEDRLAPAVLTFRQDVDGYTGAHDAEIRNTANFDGWNRNYGERSTVNVDKRGQQTGGYDTNVLMKFENLFGNGLSQIPFGSTILSAELSLWIFDPGNNPRMHRLLTCWDEMEVTWNNFTRNGNSMPGVQPDGLEAVADSLSFYALQTGLPRVIDVAADMQVWANGVYNHGWAVLPTGAAGVDWYSSEYADVNVRPQLRIDFTPPAVSLPLAQPDMYLMPPGGVLNVAAPGVLGNDAGGAAVSGQLISGPSFGTLTFNNDGSFTYQPGPNFPGKDCFIYRANDGATDTNETVAMIMVQPQTGGRPLLSNLSATSVLENGVAVLTGSVSEPDSDDPMTLTVNWGEGSPETIALPAGTRSFSVNHLYRDDNPTATPGDVYTISVTLADDDGSDSGSTTTTVSNVAPVLSGIAATTAGNNVFRLTGSVNDPSTQDTFQLAVVWGDGASETFTLAAGVANFDVSHAYAEPADTVNYTISLTLTDDDTGNTSASTSVIVSGGLPALGSLAITSAVENGFASLTVPVTDPGLASPYSLTITWGDGSSPQVLNFPGGPTTHTFDHQYLDDNPTGTLSDVYTVSVTLQTPAATTRTISTTVSNVAPTLGSVVAAPPDAAGIVHLTGTLSDPGRLDTSRLTVFWGDGVTETFDFAAGATSFDVVHRYADTGTTVTYTIALVLIDDDAGSTSASTSVTIGADGLPTLGALAITSTVENGSARLTVPITDPNSANPYSLTITWGDGATQTFSFPGGSITHTFDHQYLDDNPTATPSDAYTISVTLQTPAATTRTISTTVSNVAPTLGSVAAAPPDAAGIVHLAGTISDPGRLDTFQLSVNWGDGVTETFDFAAGATSFDVGHRYPDLGLSLAYSIGLTLTDDDTGSASGSASVTITPDGLPSLGIPTITSTVENGFARLTVPVEDLGPASPYSLTITWGDGATQTFSFPGGSITHTFDHQYLDDNPTATPSDLYTVRVTLQSLAPTTRIFSTTVSNVAPTLGNVLAVPPGADGRARVTGTLSDPGRLDTFQLTVNWGDGVTETFDLAAGTTSFDVSHLYTETSSSTTYSIGLTLVDDDTGSATAATSVTILAGGPPTLGNLSVTSTDENGFVNLTVPVADPGLPDPYTVTINWGDGTTETLSMPGGPKVLKFDHQYLDDNPSGTSVDTYTISATLSGSGSGVRTIGAQVRNVAPRLSNVAVVSSLDGGGGYTLSGFFSDPGTQDTFVLSVDWGDGVIEQVNLAAGSTFFQLNHTYDNPDVSYRIRVRLTDDDGGTDFALAGTTPSPSLGGLIL